MRDAQVVDARIFKDETYPGIHVLRISYVMPSGLERFCAVRISCQLKGWRKAFRLMSRNLRRDWRKNRNTQPEGR